MTMPPLASRPIERVPLNAIDHFILVADRKLRRRGLPGLPVQFHAHFRGRLDPRQLQDAADRLATRWPLITARLVRAPRPAWVPTGVPRCRIREETLDSDGEAAVLRAVERLLGEPFDLEDEPPVRLIVLHRPSSDDVLTIQFSHVLTDGQGGISLLRQLLDPGQIPPGPEAAHTPTDPVNRVLVSTPLRARITAVRRGVRWWLQAQPVTLPRREKPATPPSVGRITLRWLDHEASDTLHERLERLGPFANLALLMAASGFRTLSRYVGASPAQTGFYEMPLPYSRRTGLQKRSVSNNLSSRVILVARPSELGDRDGLVRLLAAQMRQALREDTSIRAGKALSVFAGLDRWAPWVIDWIPPRPRSLRVTTWPEVMEPGRAALGATVEYCWGNLICVVPPGVSIDLFKVGRRQLVAFMHSPEVLSDEQASQFLDDWLDDVCRP